VNLNPADTSYGEQVLDPSLRRRSARIVAIPISNHELKRPADAGLSVGDTGLEPVTSALSRRRSPS
jgi:hypothetical protein